MISIKEAESKLNIKERRIRALCSQGRIDGAEKKGRDWMMPDDPVVSAAGRIRPSKYPKASK